MEQLKENGSEDFACKDTDKEPIDEPTADVLNNTNKKGRRLGVARGKIVIPDDFDEMDKEIEEMFDL